MTIAQRILQRFEIPLKEAVTSLLGDRAAGCESWEVRLKEDRLVIDLVPPEEKPTQSVEAGPGQSDAPKGGKLAQRAGILCGEQPFWKFTDTSNAEEAAEWLRVECNIRSRSMLDHDQAAALKFKDVLRRYKVWMNGYGV